MTTPNYGNPGTPGHTGMPDSTASTASTSAGQNDDVSFSRTGPSSATTPGSWGGQSGQQSGQGAMDTMKDTMSRGMDNAQDALGQLQSKANELTSRLINNVDIDDLTQKLEQQVREHPARTLLMAAGAGFLLGRAAKK